MSAEIQQTSLILHNSFSLSLLISLLLFLVTSKASLLTYSIMRLILFFSLGGAAGNRKAKDASFSLIAQVQFFRSHFLEYHLFDYRVIHNYIWLRFSHTSLQKE